ncbi:MAG: lytic transglycosylase domain-containing protein [Proteobacteria bacterium]|nr:lytic transglycosylase domain-containing protein [Pseudomonadota bacterium]
MTFGRAALFVLGTSLAAIAAYAQTDSDVLTPVPDASTDAGYTPDGEKRPGAARVLSAGDHDLYGRAFDAADRGDWTAARGLAAQGHDGMATRLVTFRYVLDRNSAASFSEIDGFLRNNPGWPLRDTLYARAEVAMDPAMTPQAVIAWFGGRDPVTGIGMVRLGDALIATGSATRGKDLVRRGWVSGSFQPDVELAIVQKDGGLFTPEIDRARMSNLIARDEITAAQRELSRVTDDVQILGKARIALRSNRAAGEKLAALLPASLRDDPGLLFDRARAARKANDNLAAARLLGGPTMRKFARNHSSTWWGEANQVVRNLLATANYARAYDVVDTTGLSSGIEFSDSEFMAGWIALRFLKKPSVALAHFKKLEAGVSRPISLARARYWKGRSYEAMHDPKAAYGEYRLASTASETFYGQLALARIDATPILHVDDMAVDMTGVAPEFEKDEMVRAMRILADLGQVNTLRTFALWTYDQHPEPKRAKYLTQFLTDLGFREIALRVAKRASYAGNTFLAYTHPVIPIPAYQGPGTAPDPAMVLGLIRQETEFDPSAVSHAGARGLMQMMLVSAKQAAARAGLPYRPNDLVSDPTYNVQLGMVEYEGNVMNYGGSFVLAMAAYNAGPGNARKWLTLYGDPRNPGVDPIDWIELIPFTETRNYVQRVLENTQIYRNRLAGKDTQTRILTDLYAPLTPPDKVLAPPPG